MSVKACLIIGMGSIGLRHLNNLREIEPDCQIFALRRPESLSLTDQVDFEVYSIEEALTFEPSLAIIASPASFHIETATMLAEHGVHLMIEKPLSVDEVGVLQLLASVQKCQVSLLVAYNFRFSLAAKKVKELLNCNRIGKVLSAQVDTGQYLPSWRPDSNYWHTVSAQACLGGGALLELSHEFDYLRWFLGDVREVFCLSKNTGALEIDVEDSADILLRTCDQVPVNVHIDFLQRKAKRQCKLIGSEGQIVWDAVKGEVHLWEGECLEPEIVRFDLSRNDMYLDEMKHFLDCVDGQVLPAVDGLDALRTLRVVLAAKESAISGQVVVIKDGL